VHVPDEVLRRLTEIAEREGVLLVPVVHESHRQLVARLTQQAARLQHAAGRPRDDVPLRDFDTSGTGALPRGTRSDANQTMVLLATRTDDQLSWLRAGEALQHMLLELTRLGWVAGPLTQAVEVPVTRIQLRAALTWNAHPQMVVSIGRAPSTVLTPLRRRGDVVVGGPAPSGPRPVPQLPAATGRAGRPVH
jgi:hypothetical protein